MSFSSFPKGPKAEHYPAGKVYRSRQPLIGNNKCHLLKITAPGPVPDPDLEDAKMLRYSISADSLLSEPATIPIRCLQAQYSGMIHDVENQSGTIFRQMFDMIHHVSQPVASSHAEKDFDMTQCANAVAQNQQVPKIGTNSPLA
ncbi:charged multivesicular body protein 2b [Limosa lapponica baueri]|uniref:Charged multivesicular body protein 2b n=1 Tax=Limosa lapponica baueri TaxID=1758121 RepID=A0A2I0UGX9_LIMLA|nr:charged multivesicular body protein 2b [Limosa lapponica baueri]